MRDTRPKAKAMTENFIFTTTRCFKIEGDQVATEKRECLGGSQLMKRVQIRKINAIKLPLQA